MISFCIFNNHLSIALFISLNVILTASTQPELKLVNVVFRHGDRTPGNNEHESFPTDPYANDSFLPTGAGQLTNQGKIREYELGLVLRSRYKDFLGDLYLPKLVVGHSSFYDRTKMSLQLVLAALFPPMHHRQRWNIDLNWQPIPTTYISHIDDNFYLGYECPKYINEYDRILNFPEVIKKMSRFKDIMNKLSELTSKNIEKPLDLLFLYHTFVAESSINLTLPEWTHDYFPDGPLLDTIILSYNITNFTPLITKLNAGRMIRTIFNNMITAKNPIPLNTKFYLYSGHEANIASMLHVFQLYKPRVPEYSSAVILELLKQNRQYYVKILYYRGIPPIFDELQIPGCEMLCPFDKFSYLIHDFIPSDEDIVCDKRQTPDYANTEYPSTLESKTYNLIKKHKFNGKINSQ